MIMRIIDAAQILTHAVILSAEIAVSMSGAFKLVDVKNLKWIHHGQPPTCTRDLDCNGCFRPPAVRRYEGECAPPRSVHQPTWRCGAIQEDTPAMIAATADDIFRRLLYTHSADAHKVQMLLRAMQGKRPQDRWNWTRVAAHLEAMLAKAVRNMSYSDPRKMLYKDYYGTYGGRAGWCNSNRYC